MQLRFARLFANLAQMLADESPTIEMAEVEDRNILHWWVIRSM